MFEVISYNPSNVFLSVAGYNCVGWEEISIERQSQNFIFIKGIRGKHTRVRDPNTSALVTISLMQVSPTNDVLSKIVNDDYQIGTGRIDLLLKDTSGNSLYKSSEAYITGFPKTVYRDSVELCVWTIQCQTMDDYTVGGNLRPNDGLIKAVLDSI